MEMMVKGTMALLMRLTQNQASPRSFMKPKPSAIEDKPEDSDDEFERLMEECGLGPVEGEVEVMDANTEKWNSSPKMTHRTMIQVDIQVGDIRVPKSRIQSQHMFGELLLALNVRRHGARRSLKKLQRSTNRL